MGMWFHCEFKANKLKKDFKQQKLNFIIADGEKEKKYTSKDEAANGCDHRLSMCLQKFFTVILCYKRQETAMSGRAPVLRRRLLIFLLSFIIIIDVSSARRESCNLHQIKGMPFPSSFSTSLPCFSVHPVFSISSKEVCENVAWWKCKCRLWYSTCSWQSLLHDFLSFLFLNECIFLADIYAPQESRWNMFVQCGI